MGSTDRPDFLDDVTITAVSGHGGRGCISFRRARFLPKGGPDGGDGGAGGNVIIRTAAGLNSLAHFRHKRYFKAQNGSPGSGQNRTGKDGKDVIIETLPGTLVYDKDSGDLIVDLTEENQEYLLLAGGKGGRGNQHFATSTRRTPRIAQLGRPGEERRLRLSLKYIADVGIVGFPNAGKSTLLSSLTMARPKIDDYPFTTIHPHLGVLGPEDGKRITVADIPGLIEGASQGRGLGHRFLKHIERTRLLLYLLDLSYVPEENLLEDFLVLRRELEDYDSELLQKEQMVAVNKIDLGGRRKVGDMMAALRKMGLEVFAISAVTGEGLDGLKEALFRRFSEDGKRD
jgi:GTP-binding protein